MIGGIRSRGTSPRKEKKGKTFVPPPPPDAAKLPAPEKHAKVKENKISKGK